MAFELDRASYVARFGPTTGDRVRLADTELIIRVEEDRTVHGEEATFGVGGVVRDGMGQSQATYKKGAVDTVITNALIVDHWGIVKADIGIKDGRIDTIGKAGNSDVQPNVDILIGPGTEIIAGEGRIVTAGGIDSHVNFICPQLAEEALFSGVTTLLGGGTGPAAGSLASTTTPGPWHIGRMLQAAEGLPVNMGVFGKGNSSRPDGLREQVMAGACGLELHEGWGATPAAIDNCLAVAELVDVQVALHTDRLNESGFVEDVLQSLGGRTVRAFHAPDVDGDNADNAGTVGRGDNADTVGLCALSNVLLSSAGVLRPPAPGPRGNQEDILHDLGVISILSSGSWSIGRVGELVTRAWRSAHRMKVRRGSLPEETDGDDNLRVKRYIAKYTINPAIAHGIAQHVGSVEVGKLADLVLWAPMFFGVKPEMVLKCGAIAAAAMGDPNGLSPRAEPIRPRPMFGALGRAMTQSSVTFVSRQAIEESVSKTNGLTRPLISVWGTRTIGRQDMVHNGFAPHLEIDHETRILRADGRLLTCESIPVTALAQRYSLF
ncbi:MAG: urease subunit alpha [Alphaproteobacteria bacterium]|nr:urease subunit alpha [Alphaproteobacteria bacterium]